MTGILNDRQTERENMGPLDMRMIVHSPGGTNFNTLYKVCMKKLIAHLILEFSIDYLQTVVGGVTGTLDRLGDMEGHSLFPSAFIDMIIDTLTNALKLSKLVKAVLHQPQFKYCWSLKAGANWNRRSGHKTYPSTLFSLGLGMRHAYLYELFSLSQS